MSLARFQKTLARVYSDGTFRRRILRGSAVPGLTGAENAALGAIDARKLEAFCRGLKRKIAERYRR